jgi:hypothetical protein
VTPERYMDEFMTEIAGPLRFIATMKSPLPGISDAAWGKFVKVMETAKPRSITISGGYGAFDMRPRRLVELGYANVLKRGKNGKREVWKCEFVRPWTERKFLGDSFAQYAAFRASMMRYAEALRTDEIKYPEGCSLAGALAILHVGGRGALKGFPKLFEQTKKLYDAAKGIF